MGAILRIERMKIGIVGGHGHECIRIHPEAEFAWALDGYDDRAAARAQTRGGKIFPDLDALLEGFCPDLIYIGSAYARNGRLAAQALRAGRNVVCEKPIANSAEDLRTLRELTEASGLGIVAEFAMRWNPAVRRVRDLIREGALGRIVHVQAQKTYKFGASRPDFYRQRETFGGIIPWVACHAIDYAAWCTGLDYQSVCASHGNRAFPDYPGMEDHAAMFFQMTGGVPCLITADFLRPEGAESHGDDRLRVTGEKAVVEMINDEVSLIESSGTRKWSCPATEALAIERARDLVEAAFGRPGPLSMRESFAVTEVALAAREAADERQRTGRLTEVPIPAK
jgi:predicted dehydrogenase